MSRRLPATAAALVAALALALPAGAQAHGRGPGRQHGHVPPHGSVHPGYRPMPGHPDAFGRFFHAPGPSHRPWNHRHLHPGFQGHRGFGKQHHLHPGFGGAFGQPRPFGHHRRHFGPSPFLHSPAWPHRPGVHLGWGVGVGGGFVILGR